MRPARCIPAWLSMQTNPLFPNMWPASTGSQTGVPACCPSWCPTCVQQCGLTRPDALPLHVQVARQHLQPDVGPCLLTNMAPHMRGVPAPRSATGEEARQAFLRARGCWPPADTQVQRLTGDPFALFLLLAAGGCDSVNGREGHTALAHTPAQPDATGPTLSQEGSAVRASSHSAALPNRDGSASGTPGGHAVGVSGGSSGHCQAQHTQTEQSAGQDGLQAFAEMLQARRHAVLCYVGLVAKWAGKEAHTARHQPDCPCWSSTKTGLADRHTQPGISSTTTMPLKGAGSAFRRCSSCRLLNIWPELLCGYCCAPLLRTTSCLLQQPDECKAIVERCHRHPLDGHAVTTPDTPVLICRLSRSWW